MLLESGIDISSAACPVSAAYCFLSKVHSENHRSPTHNIRSLRLRTSQGRGRRYCLCDLHLRLYGQPKGVTLSHRSALNKIDGGDPGFEIAKPDKILAFSELSFYPSVHDLYGLLTAGGTIVFP